MIEIKNRWTGAVVYTSDRETLRAAMQEAARGGADLGGADLGGADLGGADLGGADLGDADLGDANLRDANLRGAYLRGANLGDADLGGADLGDANLRGANLRGANLGDANLRDANLRGANLRGANLGDADLGGASLSIPWLDQAIEIATRAPEALDMRDWHGPGGAECGTTHCRAGHVVALAARIHGKQILDLEDRMGTSTLAAMIYVASGRPIIPAFHGSDADARADIVRCAQESA